MALPNFVRIEKNHNWFKGFEISELRADMSNLFQKYSFNSNNTARIWEKPGIFRWPINDSRLVFSK